MPEEIREKLLKKRLKEIRKITKKFKTYLDYDYDASFENYHESMGEEDNEEDYDLSIFKKEEKAEHIEHIFTGDETCYITDVRSHDKNFEGSLFEGIDLPANLLAIE